MIVPAFGPLALAGAAQSSPMHCMRRPLQPSPAAEPAMHCHHAAAQSAAPQSAEPQSSLAPPSSETSLSSPDCCSNHDCCRSLKTSEWARPASAQLSVAGLQIEPAPSAALAVRLSAPLTGPDSARAPPSR